MEDKELAVDSFLTNDSGIEADKNQASSSSPILSDEYSMTTTDTNPEKLHKDLSSTTISAEAKPKAASVNYSRTKTREGGPTLVSKNGASKKNLMPHSLLSIPPKSTPIESQPLVDLGNLSSGDEDEFSLPLPVIHHDTMSKKEYRRVQTKEPWSPKEGLKYDGFSLTDSGDELDLIPPSSTPSRCSCSFLCPSLFSSHSYYKTHGGT